MAGRGPSPKSPEERQRRNAPAPLVSVTDADGQQELVAVAPVPAPPYGLLKVTRDRWIEFWGSPVANLADRVSDRPALERLFSLYDDLERCGRVVRKAGHMVEGSKGQLVMNPLLRHMQAQAAEVRQLEDRFGLSPRARLGLNMTLGQTAKTLADLNSGFVGGEGDDDDPRLDDAIPGRIVEDDGEAPERSA